MNDISKYIVDKKGKTESFVDLKLINVDKELDSKKFIKNYKISNFFYGKFFLKRLIKKIFKYKLNKKISWNNNFWNKIKIVKVKVSFNFKDSQINRDDLIEMLEKKMDKKRLNDIKHYSELINNDNNLDYPLYIDNTSLNFLGANISKDIIYLV